MNQLFLQIKNLFANLPVGNRISFFVLLILFLSAFGAIVFWGTTPDYDLLYANLDTDDASAVVAKLRETKVPYKIENNGSSIYVPSDQIYDIRMQLASEGVPKGGGVGFEIFDKNSFGLTDFVQKVNYQRALEGELKRTIAKLDEVSDVRVHLAIPEESLFLEGNNKPKASVVLHIIPNQSLSKKQVMGIVNLVSGSVQRLLPENVTVIDSKGNILSSKEKDGPGGMGSSLQIEYKQTVEAALEKRMQTMLEKVVGKDNVISRVTADINFQQIELTEEKYDPDSLVVRSEEISEERNVSAPAAPPSQENYAANGNTNESTNSNEVKNYEINKTISHQTIPSGNIKSLSVAVLINGTYNTSGESGESEYLPRTEEEMNKFNNIVKTAMGFVEERGDKVEVVNIPFETTQEVPEISPAGFFDSNSLDLLIKYLSILLSIVIIYFLILRPVIGWITRPVSQQELALSYPMSVSEAEKKIEGISEQQQSGAAAKQKAFDLAKNNPELAGKIIKGWLNNGS